MSNTQRSTRTRFAPSPSGLLHLGNARSAIISFLCALQDHGTFILRIEDTDLSRTKQEYYEAILYYLNWLSINPQEGPKEGGPYGPYIQSQRTQIYQKYLEIFIQNGWAYRCFATQEESERKKQEQKLLGLPPRHQRTILSIEQEKNLLDQKKDFVWRFKIPEGLTTIEDKARGKITYELKNFSDCPLTRVDGSFTFLFANFVDDVEMKITHVLRGEEHMSNTATQAAMYDLMGIEKPLFYHMPLLCNKEGKKLSKRDFGFSLQDLIDAGFLPEAICNYLLIIGGSFEQEILSLKEAADMRLFDSISSSGSIQYDVDKLKWINKKWIARLTNKEFTARLRNFLFQKNAIKENEKISEKISSLIQQECHDLTSAQELYQQLTRQPSYCEDLLHPQFIRELHENFDGSYEELNKTLKAFSTKNQTKSAELWHDIRICLTGASKGISLKLIMEILGKDESKKRLISNTTI